MIKVKNNKKCKEVIKLLSSTNFEDFLLGVRIADEIDNYELFYVLHGKDGSALIDDYEESSIDVKCGLPKEYESILIKTPCRSWYIYCLGNSAYISGISSLHPRGHMSKKDIESLKTGDRKCKIYDYR